SRRRHTRLQGDWSSDVCSSDLHLCGQYVAEVDFWVVKRDEFMNVDWIGPACKWVSKKNISQVQNDIAVLVHVAIQQDKVLIPVRSEERRVGKECRYRWSLNY